MLLQGKPERKPVLTIAASSPHSCIMYKTKAHFTKLLILNHHSVKNFRSFRKCFQVNGTTILY